MSVPTVYLMNDSALKIGDPRTTRVTPPEWTLFYNQSTRELCQKANVFQNRALFNLGAQSAYHYPDEMTTMTGMEVTDTPDDDNSWRQLGEIFEDEFRALTSGRYADNTLPESYFADRLGFYLFPRPTGTIVNGGRITYYGLPDRITDILTAEFQLPDFAQDYVIRRMVVHGLRARNRHIEATNELNEWNADVDGLADKLEDRSDDRRSSLRPRLDRMRGMR